MILLGGNPLLVLILILEKIAKSFNYNKVFRIEKLNDFDEIFMNFQKEKGPCLLEIIVNKGARKDLGRPTVSPKENKLNFMSFIK